MREMGIEAIYQKPNLSVNAMPHPVYPYLLQGVTASHPNHIWGTDITYIRMHQGFVYLTAYLDWFSRFVLSWRLSTTLEIGFVLEAAEEALNTYDHRTLRTVIKAHILPATNTLHYLPVAGHK